MDCIFRDSGIIPQNYACYHCIPLEKLFLSAGCDYEEAVSCSKRIRRADSVIALEDEFRDEAIYRKIISKAWSILYLAGLPSELRKALRKLNSEVTRLERAGADLNTYLTSLSQLGGLLFGAAGSSKKNQEKLNSIGAIITETMLVKDMVKDLNSDIKTSKFNPIKGYNSVRVANLLKQTETKFNKLAEPLLNIKNIKQTPPKKRDFWEDFLYIFIPNIKRRFFSF